jgi:hypothetical protein
MGVRPFHSSKKKVNMGVNIGGEQREQSSPLGAKSGCLKPASVFFVAPKAKVTLALFLLPIFSNSTAPFLGTASRTDVAFYGMPGARHHYQSGAGTPFLEKGTYVGLCVLLL